MAFCYLVYSHIVKIDRTKMKATLPGRKTSGPTAALLGILMALWLGVAVAVSLSSVWNMVELKLLDRMTVASAPNKSSFPITIIGIDEESFARLGLQWPWPRSLHATLVDRLTAAGAAVIVFDVVFSEPSNTADDKRFADAIQRAGNVVLAANRTYHESSSIKQWTRIDPLPIFLEAGAKVGLATVPLDRDLVMRQIPEPVDSLWRTVILRLLRDHPDIMPNLGISEQSYVRYVGPDHTFPYLSYHEIVRPDGSIPDDFLKDNVVIIGFDVKASADVQSAQSDLFATPFIASTGGLSPGAEVHANIIETALGKNAIVRTPQPLVSLLLAMVTVASGLLMRRWRPFLSALSGLALGLGIAGLAWGLFVKMNIWLPVLASLCVIPLMYFTLGGWAYVTEQIRRREITRAFSLYVTPQVVDQIIEHPERLNLQGELRNITIMFTDLAGFTTISEQLSAERVTDLLNRHFTEMTDIVLEHNGTVARFIGDAIMAFWGAPLDDEDQAYRAVVSAVAMQSAMEFQRNAFAREGLPPVNMRVGIHSGTAVVGNLGSAKRFDYTAIGDDVNLAARLEGTNKLYGTGIMISGETASRIEGRIPLRPLDRVIVKGKSQPVEIFTPCDNESVVDLTKQAIYAFRRRDWDTSESVLQELLKALPDDRIAPIYLDRIAEFRLTPPPESWDGAMELEKL